jgi:hypothetical protein
VGHWWGIGGTFLGHLAGLGLIVGGCWSDVVGGFGV